VSENDPPRNLTLGELWRIVQGDRKANEARFKDMQDAIDELNKRGRWTRAEVMQFVSVLIAALVVVWSVYTATKGAK
jgi:hypothetical protein